MSRNLILRECPYCKNSFSKLWFHIRKNHKDKLDDYESVVLNVMNMSTWPIYEIDGVIYKYNFIEKKYAFRAQTCAHGAILSCRKEDVLVRKREAMRKVWERDDYKNLLSKLRTGTKRSEEIKKKMSNSIKLAFKEKNCAKKISDARKRFYEKNGYYSGYMDPSYFRYRNKSKSEYKFELFMKSIGINVISHDNHFEVFDRNLNRFNCYPDFLIEYKGYKLLVEFDGKYYHTIDLIPYEVTKDYSLYKLYGLKVLRIFDTVAFNEDFLLKKLDWTIVNKPYFYEYNDIETIYKLKEELNSINFLDDIKLLEYKVD